MPQLILNLSCPDRSGIVAATTKHLAEAGANITASHQFGDTDTGRFFMRVAFDAPDGFNAQNFTEVAKQFEMDYAVFEAEARGRAVILVSKFDHCLADLIYRTRAGSLNMDIVEVLSNHEVAKQSADYASVPFFYDADKNKIETRLRELIEKENVELIILARYMQVLSADLVQDLSARIINIHHSFLPSFKGAEPYSRAHARGVKMIGATAHFVTPELDEGPIITQGVALARHDMGVGDLVDVGRDVERRTLAHAIKLYWQRRILVNGEKTVIFE